jgi:hypothetical protein
MPDHETRAFLRERAVAHVGMTDLWVGLTWSL